MSIRGVWIISIHNAPSGKLLFSRSFPIVEQRVKLCEGDDYVPLPENKDAAKTITDSLGMKYSSDQFVSARDSCEKVVEKPVFDVNTALGGLWPLLVVEQFGILLCCMPFVEGGSQTRPPLIDIPGLSNGFSLLVGMADFIGPLPKNVDQFDERVLSLHQYMSEAAPLGSVIEVNPGLVRAALLAKSVSNHVPDHKQPAMRQLLERGKNHITFSVIEQVRAILYDKPNVEDAVQVFGHVTCESDIDGIKPEVSVSFAPSLHTSFLFNPCVQQVERKDGNADQRPTNIQMIAPQGTFTLCQYTVSGASSPVQAFYQVRGETEVSIFVQVKLSDKVKNNLEYCELQMPFFHRGSISHVDSTPSHGIVLVAPTKHILVWNIGQKFPKSLEVSLKATLKFLHYEPSSTTMGQDPFCIGNNCYAQLLFKIKDCNLSGIQVDSKSIQLKPQARLKTTSSLELSSLDYKIWNSHGDAPFSLPPPPQFTQAVSVM